MHVYHGVSAKGRAIAAGSCPTVGIAGLTLGGGVGALSRAYGLTCDFVKGLQVVTADGQVRTASRHHEPDLFWALRGGGGGHLGVVTAFKLKTVAAPTLRTAFLQWPASAATSVLETWQAWAPTNDARLWSTCRVLGGQKRSSGPVVLVSVTWTGSGRRLRGQARRAAATRAASGGQHPSHADLSRGDVLVRRVQQRPGRAVHHRPRRRAPARVPGGHVPRRLREPPSAVAASATLIWTGCTAPDGLREAGISLDALGGRVADVAPDETAFVHREAMATVQYTATFPPGTPTKADRGFCPRLPRRDGPALGQPCLCQLRRPDGSRATGTPTSGQTPPGSRRCSAAYDPHGFFTQPQDY